MSGGSASVRRAETKNSPEDADVPSLDSDTDVDSATHIHMYARYICTRRRSRRGRPEKVSTVETERTVLSENYQRRRLSSGRPSARGYRSTRHQLAAGKSGSVFAMTDDRCRMLKFGAFYLATRETERRLRARTGRTHSEWEVQLLSSCARGRGTSRFHEANFQRGRRGATSIGVYE